MDFASRPALILGAHFSIAGGLERAILEAASRQCNTLQLFTKNAMTWKEKPLTESAIQKFTEIKTKTGIDNIISHASYLINIAGPDPKKAAMSCSALKQEILRCRLLDIPCAVLHPGAHMGEGEAKGIARIAENINRIFEQTGGAATRLLLETTAGQGTSIGHRFEQLAAVMDQIEDKSRIGVCMDTCHIFAAGYDISDKSGYEKTMADFDDIVGLNNLRVLHLNDAKKAGGTRVDRHEHIGEGFIGIHAFELIINDARLQKIPKIIETPKIKNTQDGDTVNLDLLRKLQIQ